MAKKIDALVEDLLRTHPGDPANARYLAPLDDPEQESLARLMRDAMYCCGYEPRFRDDITREQADRVWDQCLIDARRMVCDEGYERIFIE